MIKELIELDFPNVKPPGALFSLDLIVHHSDVYKIKGPVAIHTVYFNNEDKLFSYKLDSLLERKIAFVKRELEKAGVISKAIVITNLDQEFINEFKQVNQIPEGIFLWGSLDVKKLLSRHKDVLSKYNHQFFIKNIDEEIRYLTKDSSQRNEQIKYNNQKYLKNISERYYEGNLVLVLGAGVSMSANIPSWNELVKKIYFEALASKGINIEDIEIEADVYWQLTEEFGNNNLLIRTRYAKQLLGEKFLDTVQKWLYKDSCSSSKLIKSIAKLCKEKINSIITYNFDDLIEKQLDLIGRGYSSIWRADQIVKPNTLPIYHVHGFIPREHILTDNIVFSEEEYHEQYIYPYSWSNIIQLDKFREKSCLFIGTSLLDPNIRRLLDASQQISKVKQHYIIMKRIFTEKNLSKTIQNNKQVEEVLSKLPVEHYLHQKLKHTKLNDEVIQNTMLTEELLIEKDFKSLGINVIWVNDFDEIPDVLDDITRKSMVVK